VKISRADAVALCTGLGFKTAGKWDKQRMIVKLKDVIQMVDDCGEVGVEEDTPDADRLNKLLVALAKAKDELELVSKIEGGETESVELEEQAVAEPVAEKPAKKAKKKPEPKVEEEEEEEVEEKPAKKAKKEKKEKPAKVASKGGIRSIENRRYMAGIILREHGLDGGVTEGMIKEVDDKYGKSNMDASRKQLVDAWHALNGYLNG
jgi:hypothetical protein